MPGQDGVGFDKEGRPAVAAEHASERGENRPVGGFEAGSWYLTVQDAKLMAENEDLDIFGTSPATAQHQQVDHEADKSVEADHSPIAALLRSAQITPRTPARNPRSTCLNEFPAPTGFVRSIEQTLPGRDPHVAMGYWQPQALPFYASLATTFALADHWYSSCLGPTFPNRRFLIAATANGLIDDVPLGMIDYPKTGTVFDLLDRHKIPWVNYHHTTSSNAILARFFGGIAARGLRGLGLLLSTIFPSLLRAAQGNLQFTADLYPVGVLRRLRHLRSIERFLKDAASGDLPAVSIVDPDFQTCSEENPQDIRAGEGFAAAVIDAVTHGPGWEHTMLIWFYDEHGGYFDHVAPPPAPLPDAMAPRSLLDSGAPVRWLLRALGLEQQLKQIDSGGGRYDNYGFRVPAVVVSPYARPNHVSSQIYDHTSVLKLIEEKWNLPPLTARDAHARAPLDMIDLAHPPPLLTPPKLTAPATSWPPAQPNYPRRVRIAQALGLVGRRTPDPGGPPTDTTRL